jgi:TfuA protein
VIPVRMVVFAGPSLDHQTAARLTSAELLPPVQRGDVDRLLRKARRPDAIGIVDGRFLQSLAISPREVLRAVDGGVAVYGSSSIGALRAVECGPYGMVGVGRIFEEYRSGRTDRDDEVAMTYDPDTLRPLSEPLVNLRLGVAHAVAEELVPAATAERFVEAAWATYFPDRTVPTVLDRLRGHVPADELARLRAFFADDPPDAKREDAIELLRVMNADAAERRRSRSERVGHR